MYTFLGAFFFFYFILVTYILRTFLIKQLFHSVEVSLIGAYQFIFFQLLGTCRFLFLNKMKKNSSRTSKLDMG